MKDNKEYLKNFFFSFEKIIEPFEIDFKFRNRIVFLPKDENYIFIFFRNLDKIKKQKRILKMKPKLRVKIFTEQLEKIEKSIKYNIISFLENNWENFSLKFWENIISENIHLTKENAHYLIEEMELGKISKLLILINNYCYKFSNFKKWISNVSNILGEKANNSFDLLMYILYGFIILRNCVYHYNTLDQVLLQTTLKLIEYNILKEEKRTQKENKSFKVLSNDKEWKYSLIYDEIDYFKISFKIIENLLKFFK